jgi:hypothetical protein
MNSNFSFIQIRNDGEDLIHIFKERLEFIKKFMKIKYYYVDPKSYNFIISRNIIFESHFRPPTNKEYNILITYDINIY